MSLQIFAVLLLAHQALAWFETCDMSYSLTKHMILQSPNYPWRYRSGSSCRYTFTAPLDYKIRMQCTIKLDKASKACSSELFYVSVDGDANITNSENYCGYIPIDVTTQFNKLSFGYTSSSSQTAGYFSCGLTLIPPTASNCDCGWNMVPRIVDGNETLINEFPSMVGLVHKPDNGIFCGGTIINHNYILSSAHCFNNTFYNNISELVVRVGEHDTKTTAESEYTREYPVVQIITHSQYNPSAVLNDIALVRVQGSIEWSIGVGPACLPYIYRTTNFTNDLVTAVGWGTTSFGGPRTTVLRKATVVVDSQSDCNRYYSQIISSQMCTKPQLNSNSDSCQSDSGGPVYYENQRQYVLGIISYGRSCGTQNPSVNTRVSEFLSWIESNTGGGFCRK